MAARMNISIPDELKARMDAQGSGINWSRLAALAFERRLDDMNDDLLRTAKQGTEEAMEQSDGGSALEALLSHIREERPGMVDLVRDDLGRFITQVFDRQAIKESLLDPKWKSEFPHWPLQSPEEFVKVVREFVFGYHERVVTPLITEIAGKVMMNRIETLAEDYTRREVDQDPKKDEEHNA